MSVRSCKVTIEDMNGVRHTVDVTAGSLYEAVALGMAAIRTDEWVNGIAQGLNPVKVRVTNVAVEHEVKVMNFTEVAGSEWLVATRDDGKEAYSIDSWDGQNEWQRVIVARPTCFASLVCSRTQNKPGHNLCNLSF